MYCVHANESTEHIKRIFYANEYEDNRSRKGDIVFAVE
jgi:hypothetical protein